MSRNKKRGNDDQREQRRPPTAYLADWNELGSIAKYHKRVIILSTGRGDTCLSVAEAERLINILSAQIAKCKKDK